MAFAIDNEVEMGLLKEIEANLADVYNDVSEATRYDDVAFIMDTIESIADNSSFKKTLQSYVMNIMNTIEEHNDSVYAAKYEMMQMLNYISDMQDMLTGQ
jgi:prophage DNA circulation protein